MGENKPELKLPLYASPESRSIADPSILLTVTQTRQILKRIREYHGIPDGQLDGKLWLRVSMQLLRHGWERVELHGERMFLTAVVSFAATPRKDVHQYVMAARATGIWSIHDYMRWGSTPLKLVE